MAGLWLTSSYSYLLFHSLAELFSIAVAAAMFTVAWNSSRFSTNGYLTYVGIAFLSVAGLDLMHTLAFKGLGVFPAYGADLPTQLWIAARGMEAALLAGCPGLSGPARASMANPAGVPRGYGSSPGGHLPARTHFPPVTSKEDRTRD